MDMPYALVVLTPVFGLAAYCVAQIAIARTWCDRSPYHSLSLGFVCGLLAVCAAAAWSLSRMDIALRDRVGYFVLDVLTYLALAFGYFNFVNLTVASLRIRLLEELLAAGGSLPRDQLLGCYNSRTVAELRLDRLVRGGHLEEHDGRLRVGKVRFLVVARIFDALHRLIIGRRRSTGR